ncbi:hypothetical protein DJ021_09910 [Phenylobacterium hankyongense]|uniref:PepSY domain-containing protein n=1 Tax=Phenylobacterium hankyongense TaxID=1813876 RepID=A0A328B4Y1_9CAUL|nr:hypothetical protein [Phenylobacterium hankyongense]RAK60098.1 hypothetical protein DJ021_09910 [Phenylobacterium hankyongense]
MSVRRPLLCAAVLAGLLAAACGPAGPAGPVRSPMRASELAQRELRAAGLDEAVIDARRQGDRWVVTTRRRESSMAGHLVFVDARSGQVTVKRYWSVELGRRR